ncbi:MAG: hypothetical protein ABJN14_03465 [Paracoccaceae bacterium]
MAKGDKFDPKGLIFEAFQIEGITDAECRTIFLDWALSLPAEMDQNETIKTLVQMYTNQSPDHPMNVVLNEGLTQISAPRRRGGWRSRPRN